MLSTILTTLLFANTAVFGVSAEFLADGLLDNKNAQVRDDASASSHLILARTADNDDLDLIAEESAANAVSTPFPDQEPRYKLPYAFAFNGGKPFSLEKDPITGKIDFEKTPPLKALNLTDTYQDDEDESIQINDQSKLEEQYPYGKIGYLDSKRVVSSNSKNERVGPNEINPYSPSFHDFLNLPVQYSSEKYERDNYPVISSSYANTKVQSGSNSYNINNHRPYHQETATKVSISTATRKVYYPKTTSTTTTSTSTIRPKTTSSTTTSTTTTARPMAKRTTTTKPTKAPTAVPSTARPTTTTARTTQLSVTQPKITTWKPSKSTSRYDEYEDILPIEKLQSVKNSAPSKFGPTMNQDFNGHNNGPQSPSRPTPQTTYLYNDDYDDYYHSSDETTHDHGYQQHQLPHHDEFGHRIELVNPPATSSSTSAPPTSTTTARSTTTTTTTTTTTSTTTTKPIAQSSVVPNVAAEASAVVTSSSYTKQQPLASIHLTTAKPAMLPVHQQPPVTSMPLDSGNNPLLMPPVHENFVEGQHRPVEYYNTNNPNNNNIVHSTIHFGANAYSRPGSVISVLPESTSNVIVPHDQDTVSFVLGNRQNVEGSYYTLGTAMEEHPYAPNTNENNFRPMFASGSNTQQTNVDKKFSVALPSVAVVESSSASEYNPSNWYNSNPVQPDSMPETEVQTKSPSSFVFSLTDANDNNNNKQNDTLQKEKISGYIAFPDSNQDKQLEKNQTPMQRPVQEHIIIINQADGTIKEITPTGLSNPAENSVLLDGNNNNNNININNNNNNLINNHGGNNNLQKLPQLSESLTPPAESRPARPSSGGISQRPPYYFHYQHGNGNSGKPLEYPPRPQRIPLPPRQKPDLPSVGFKRRTSTPHDVKLPNILPQFRPNAKTSHGHRGADKIGTLSAPPPHGNRPRPSVAQHHSRRGQPYPPPHLQLLSPPPPPAPSHQQQLPRKAEEVAAPLMAPPKPEHLKRYRPPMPGSRPNLQKLRMEDESPGERFSAEPPQVPPRPIIFPKSRSDGQVPQVATLQMIQQRGALNDDIIRSNLPPLFKINRADEPKEDEADDKEESPVSITSNEANRRKDEEEPEIQETSGASEAAPVYVVYPVNSAVNMDNQEVNVERDESVVIGTHGPYRPLPPDTLPHYDEEGQGGEQDKSDEEKLSGFFYGKIPQHENAVNADFSLQNYGGELPESSILSREKPLLVPSDDTDEEESTPAKLNKISAAANPDTNAIPSSSSSNSSNYAGGNAAFNVISYLQDFLPFPVKKHQPSTISATLPRFPTVQASSPIAFVYTPTTPSAVHQESEDEHEEEEEEPAELGQTYERHRVEKPVLLPSQQPSSSSSSAPSPQNFMAPFVASLSAEAPARNGWSVVVANTSTERSAAARVDVPEGKAAATEEPVASTESQTESSGPASSPGAENFDPESFKPQLFGGFKPIYEFPVDEDEHTPMVGRGLAPDSSDSTS